MRVIVGLLDEREFFTLALVESRFHGVGFFESFEREDEEFRVVLIVDGREGDVVELSRFEPVDEHRVDRDGFVGLQVWTVFQVVVLAFLLVFQEETSETAHVFLANRFVDGRASADTLTIVVGGVGPPVCLLFHETKDDVFDRRRHAGNFPRDVGFPASPGFAEMLHDGSVFIRFDAFRHHVADAHHDGETEFEIEVGFVTLFRDLFRSSFRVTTFELTREQIAEPSF